jgi:hypothetical protein
MKLLFILILLSGFQTEVPFKPSDEYDVSVDLKYKIKASTYPTSTFSGSGEPLDKSSATTLPFLSVSISKIKIQNDEERVFAVEANGKSLYKKKASPNLLLRFEMGFVDDLKSKVSNNEITVYFLAKDKKKLRKILISISDKGVFEVNGKWHGQF